jgi:predicted metallo-beta-lactamase superfamily hydrolase
LPGPMDSCRDTLEEAGVELIWGDSLGAKSFAFRVGPVLVDPGAAAMHSSYPLPADEKERLKLEALHRIADASRRSSVIVITHYHYDHYARPWLGGAEYLWSIYNGKLVIAKNPNMYINESQWRRSREFIEMMASRAGVSTDEVYTSPGAVEYRLEPPPSGREAEWASKLERLWSSGWWVRSPLKLEGESFTVEVILADHGVFPVDGASVELLGPHFHGRPWERTGWVVPLIINAGGSRVLYTSDLMGPMHGEYARSICRGRVDVILADGPPYYMAPYRFPMRLIEESISNAARLVEECQPRLLVYDHHLPRRRGWSRLLERLREEASAAETLISSVAACLGREPPIL